MGVEKLLDVGSVADCLGLCRAQVHRYVRSGDLCAVKFGRRTMFREADVNAFVEKRVTRPTPPAPIHIRSL